MSIQRDYAQTIADAFQTLESQAILAEANHPLITVKNTMDAAARTAARLAAEPEPGRPMGYYPALRAVREGRAAGIWHMFNDSPAHIALIEYLAKSFHPDLFADVDPDATMAQINARFSPVTVPGIWWVTPAR